MNPIQSLRKLFGHSNSSSERPRTPERVAQLHREGRRSIHAVLENDVAVNIHHANGNRYFGAYRLCLDAVRYIFR